jgi:hypothetical protein
MIAAVLVRFACLSVSQAFAALWLLRMTEREKDVEILALRHQLAVLRRQLGDQRPRLRPEDRALLAALLAPLARATLRRLRLLVSPDTVLRWHHDLMMRRHVRTSVNRRPGRPRTVAPIARWPHPMRGRPQASELAQIERLVMDRHDLLGRIMHAYRHAL